jgi:hypothetical protein
MRRSRRARVALAALAVAVAAIVVVLEGIAGAEPPQGQIDLIAGTTAGYAPPGDNVAATTARTNTPADVAVLPDGSVLIADQGNNRIRKVDTAGTITTVAGTGAGCPDGTNPCGDGGAATAAQLNGPTGVASTGDGGFLIADSNDFRIRRVSPGGVITNAAGTGNTCSGPGFACGDGGAATNAFFGLPTDVVTTPDGGYLIADLQVNVVRKVSAAGTISRVAGNYQVPGGFGGDGLAATNALVQLNNPASVATTADGGFLIADSANHRVRKVSAGGVISTVAGNGTACAVSTNVCGDGAAATAANLNLPQGVASRSDGAFYVADTNDNRIRMVSAGGTISTIAGTGTAGSSGDGGPATTAQLNMPRGEAQCGNSLLFADYANHRVRWVGLTPLAGASPCVPTPTITTTPTTTPTTTTPTATTAQTPPPPPPPGIAPPRTGVSIVARVLRGTVRVRRPGERAFSILGAAENLPIGSEFDTRRGTVAIDFATGPDDLHSTEVSKGLFRTRQATATGSALELDLTGRLRRCPPAGRATAARRSTRQIGVRAKGPVKSKGRYGSATVRGTAWTMKDTCSTTTTVRSGTLIVVTEGVVAVADFAKRKTVVVKAGKRYFAAARKR